VTASTAAALDGYYMALQSRWSVTEEPDFADLVVPNGNGGAPVHRWFRMKEAYSCDLVPTVLDATSLTSRQGLSVCDPFCGSGTTGVSVATAVADGLIDRAAFVGLESNPYLHLVSRSKLAALQAPPSDFSSLAQRVGATVARRSIAPSPTPALSTFSESKYFDAGALEELLRVRSAIEHEAEGDASPLAVDLALVCLGSIVEGVSRLRRDGRALRYEPDKPSMRPIAAFLDKAHAIEDDLGADPIPIAADVHRLDARAASHTLKESGPFDLVLFSPPYPNNIDYTEVYKLEAWLLGFYGSQDGFRAQRWRTLRSHASLDFGDAPMGLPDALRPSADELIRPILDGAIGTSRYSAARQRTIKGYAYDMLGTLLALAEATNIGASLVYVVGNSLHGGRDGEAVLIAADLLIARLAEIAGFSIDRIAVARVPSRRSQTSPFLRESVVFARRVEPTSGRECA
jgi:hypothetical protein